MVVLSATPFRRLRALAPTLVVGSLALLARRARRRHVRQRRAPLDRRRARSRSSPPSSRSSRSRSGSRPTSRARRRRRRSSELARPIGLLVAVFCAPAPARARPRDGDRARPRARRDAARLGRAGAAARARAPAIAVALGLLAIWIEPYRRARVFSFLDPWHDAQGAGFQTVQAMIGLGSGGLVRRRPRPGRPEDLLPPRGAHGHDLRDHRRGARPRRDDRADPRLRGVRLRRAADRAPRAATRSASGSRPASRCSSAGRRRSTSRP